MTLTQEHADNQLRKHRQAGASNAVLGNLANISSTSETKYTRSSSQRNKERRFLLLDNARRILRNHNITTSRSDNPHRTRHCLAVRYDATDDIGITLNLDDDNSAAGITNLVTCGSICSCPVCAHRKMMEYAEDIKKTLVWAETNNYSAIMLTLTAEHHKGTNLEEFIGKFKSAWRYFSSGRAWRRFKQEFNIEHYITAREVTRGRNTDNGWHYHMHILLFVDIGLLKLRDNLPNITIQFKNRWMNALARNGLHGIDDIACDVRSGSHVGEMYLSKLGITHAAKGKMEYELTGSANKGASIWDILYDASFGDIEAEYLYLEYVQVMTGENWITFSHGLRDLIADIELHESSDDDKQVLFYSVSQDTWNVIVRSHRVGEFLMIVAKYRCHDKIREFIRMLKNE